MERQDPPEVPFGRTSCVVGVLLIVLSVGSLVAWDLERLPVSVGLGLVGGVMIARAILASTAAALGNSTLLVSGRPAGPDVLSVPESDRAEGSGRRGRVEESEQAESEDDG